MSDIDTLRAEKDAQIQELRERVDALDSKSDRLWHELHDALRECSDLKASLVDPSDLRSIIERAYLTDWRRTENDLIAAGLGRIVSSLRIDHQAGRLRY